MEDNLTKRERRTTAPSKAKTSSPLSDKTLGRGRQPRGGGDCGLRRLREAAHARGGPRTHHRGRCRRRRRAAHPRHLGKKHVLDILFLNVPKEMYYLEIGTFNWPSFSAGSRHMLQEQEERREGEGVLHPPRDHLQPAADLPHVPGTQ